MVPLDWNHPEVGRAGRWMAMAGDDGDGWRRPVPAAMPMVPLAWNDHEGCRAGRWLAMTARAGGHADGAA